MGYVSIDGGLDINKQYKVPSTVGIVGNSLRLPSTGNVMEWFNAIPAVPELTQLIYGNVVWMSGLTFAVSNCQYYIKGALYNSAADEITLTEADENNPRIDVIYVDIYGTVGVLTGTPAVDPAKPLVDPSTQLELTNVYVNTNATEPSGVSNVLIYDENIEWTYEPIVVDNVTVDRDYSTDPQHGTKCIKIVPTSPGTIGFAIAFVGTAIDISNGTLVFYIKTTGLEASSAMSVRLFNGANGATIFLGSNNVYGLSFTSVSWQKISIPISAFSPSISSIDKIIIKCTFDSTGVDTMYLDYIGIQTGVITPTQNITVSDNILDLNLSNNILSAIPYSNKLSVDPGYAYLYLGASSPSLLHRLNLDGSLHLSQVSTYSSSETPALSSELNIDPSGWTCGTNWTNNGNGVYTCTVGSTTLSTTIPTISGRRYLITWDRTGSYMLNGITITLGLVVLTLGASNTYAAADITASTTNAATPLSFTLNSGSNGTMSNISIKELTPNITVPTAITYTSPSGIACEIRNSCSLFSQGLGTNSLRYLSTGKYNLGIGPNTLSASAVNSYNIAIGGNSQSINILGYQNIGIGYNTLCTLINGSRNIAIGHSALSRVSTGGSNVAIGDIAGTCITTGIGNIFIGTQCGVCLTTGSINIGIGGSSLMSATTGSSNIGLGNSTLTTLSSGTYNIAIGISAGYSVTTGTYNIFLGLYGGSTITTGAYNIMIGGNNASTSQSPNRLNQSLTFSSDTNNLLLGYGATKQKLNTIILNSIAIGNYSRVYQDNQVSLGNTEIRSTYLQGKIEIRDWTILAPNSLSEPTFATHSKWLESGDVAYNLTKFTYTHNTGIGSLKQSSVDFASVIKPNTWYKISYTISLISGSGGFSWSINSSLNGTIISYGSTSYGTSYIYLKSGSGATPFGDFQLDFTSSGAKVVDITFAGIEEITGGDLYVNNDIEQRRGTYQYHRQYFGVDTDGDWRSYSDENGFYVEYYSGGWVNKHTITI